jgi:hypothetical protein
VSFRPEGAAQESPGQRPGDAEEPRKPSPERAQQSTINRWLSHLFRPFRARKFRGLGSTPRALPWAFLCHPFRVEYRERIHGLFLRHRLVKLRQEINSGRIDAGSSEARRGDVALMSDRPLNRFARAIHLAIADAYISNGVAFCVIEKQTRP